MPAEYDTAFALPGVDDDPDTEIGVLLMGLGAERLLAGLGVAGPEDDPAMVTLLVDQLRHGVRAEVTLQAAVTAGVRRWRDVRTALAAIGSGAAVRSADLRSTWAAASATVTAALAPLGRAEHVYLAACWLRRTEIEAMEDSDAIPPLPS